MTEDLANFDAGLRKARSMSLRYGLGTGLMMAAALWFDTPWLALPVWLVFVPGWGCVIAGCSGGARCWRRARGNNACNKSGAGTSLGITSQKAPA